MRRQAQNALNELESSPRGELVIAANEATCIYVLPCVFAEYKVQFPGVQLQVNRSYGSRVVEAVMENVADFGLTQLPVAEKRVQVVDIYQGRGAVRCSGGASAGQCEADFLRRCCALSSAAAAIRHDANPAE